MLQVQDYPLREKKYARTKVGLMTAFMERLKESRFDDISIREVCRDLEIAEGTFFNYFPEKTDVIGYYIQLLTSKMAWKAKRDVPSGKYIALINAFFHQVGEQGWNTNIIYQILSVLVLHSEKPKTCEISGLEKQLVFPDEPGIEDSPSEELVAWFRECLLAARRNGELPPKADIDDIEVSLVAILSGTLIAIRFRDTKSRGYHYKRQLQALWRDVGVKPQDIF